MSSDLVQSVQRAFAILKTVSTHQDGVGVSTIAQETGLHTSTVSRLITTLESVNALSRLDGGSQLIIGEGLIDLVSRAPWTERMIALARPYLRELANATRESVGLTRLDRRDGLCHVFFQIESQHHIRIRDWTGHRFQLHATSSGKLWMADWGEDALENYFRGLPDAVASNTIVDLQGMQAELVAVRESQVGWTIDELEDGLLSIAASIPSLDAKEPAAIYLSAPSFRFMDEADRQLLKEQMLETAEKIREAI